MIPRRNLRRFFYKTLRQPGYAFRVFKKRLQANLYYLLGNGRSSYPEAVTLFLTHRCNLKCRVCGQWGESGITKKQSTQHLRPELSLEELNSIIDDLSIFKPNITLFGGEPLLYNGCVKLIKYIKQKNMHCLVVTNGYLLEEQAEDIIDAGLDELNVSLDGDALLHDTIRGEPGLFNKIVRGLRQIIYFKDKQQKKRPLINLQCTITQYNYRDLEQLIDVAKQIKASSLTFHNLIFLSPELLKQQKEFDHLLGCNSSDWEGFVFQPGIEPEILSEKMKKILSAKPRTCTRKQGRYSVDFYPNFSRKELKEYYQNPDYLPSGYLTRCLSPWVVAYIFPDGQVRPCLNSSYAFGNLKENKFSQIWNNEPAKKFRRLLKKMKIFPVCVRCTELYRY